MDVYIHVYIRYPSISISVCALYNHLKGRSPRPLLEIRKPEFRKFMGKRTSQSDGKMKSRQLCCSCFDPGGAQAYCVLEQTAQDVAGAGTLSGKEHCGTGVNYCPIKQEMEPRKFLSQ